MPPDASALFQKYNKAGFVATPDEWSLLISSPEHLHYHARALHTQGAHLVDVSKFVEEVQELARVILARIAEHDATTVTPPPTERTTPRLGGLSSLQAPDVHPPARPPSLDALPPSAAPASVPPSEDAESVRREAGALLALVEVLRTRPLSERGLIPTLSRYGFQSVYPRPPEESMEELTPYGVQEEAVQRVLIPLMHLLGVVSIETHPPFLTPSGEVAYIEPSSGAYEEELKVWWRYATFYQSTFAGFAHSND